MSTKEFTVLEYVALVIVCNVIGFVSGWSWRNNTALREAVEVGHAEYFLDATNNKQWRWKPLPAEKPQPGTPE